MGMGVGDGQVIFFLSSSELVSGRASRASEGTEREVGWTALGMALTSYTSVHHQVPEKHCGDGKHLQLAQLEEWSWSHPKHESPPLAVERMQLRSA